MKNFLRWIKSPNGRYVVFPVSFAFVDTASPIIWASMSRNWAAAAAYAIRNFSITSLPYVAPQKL